MISEQKNFLFIHVPKTAGNSIQNILREYSEDSIITRHKKGQDGIERFGVKNNIYNTKKHSNLSYYKSVMEPGKYQSLFKFATIRNPWDRVVSAYFSPGKGHLEFNRDIFLALINRIVILRDFLREEEITMAGINTTVENRKIDNDIDFLIRFENLHNDFKTVCERLDIPNKSLPMRNVSKHKHYSAYYDDELEELVSQRFCDEISFGDYSFERI